MGPEDVKKRKVTKWVMIGISTVFIAVMLLAPLAMVIVNSLKKGWAFYLAAISTKTVLSALKVSLTATGITLLVNTFFGIVSALLLTRYAFRGKQFLQTLIDIPFSVSPVIAGLAFIMMFGRRGWMAPVLDAINRALRMAEDGDVIVLAGKGHETYQEIMGIKRPFDEKVIVSDLLLEIQKEKG